MNTVTRRPINTALLLGGLIMLLLVLTWPTMHMGLWLDELCSVNDVSYPTLGAVLTNMWGRMDDLHPPLYYVFLFSAIKLFGLNDFVVRTPPLVVGVLLIPTVYWLGKVVHSRWVGLVAAFFATVSPFANYYACQSRGYGLGALLMAWCLIAFIKLANPKTQNKLPAFIATAVLSAAVCYTEYPCVFVFPGLGLATVWICLAMRANPSEDQFAKSTLIRCAGALAVGLLMFAPWLPSMALQSASMQDLTTLVPRYYWPIVFATNLMMMYPTPLIITIPLFCLELLALPVYLFLRRKQFTGFKKTASSVPAPIVACICTLSVPSGLVGYLTTWYIGYFRYIYPYTAPGWVLLALLLFWMLGYKKSHEAGTAGGAQSGQRKRNLVLTGLLTSLLGVNILYLCWFDSKPQSGLRTMANDAESGVYNDSLILIAPDVIGPTIGYYFPVKDWKAHNVRIAGYPRWNDPFTPIAISDLKKLWGPESVTDAESQIRALPKQGFKYLVVAKDSDKQIDALSTATVPRAARIRALMESINRNYKQVGTETHYPGVTEDVTAYKFQLVP